LHISFPKKIYKETKLSFEWKLKKGAWAWQKARKIFFFVKQKYKQLHDDNSWFPLTFIITHPSPPPAFPAPIFLHSKLVIVQNIPDQFCF
jgi:hypothetical protein